MANVENMIDLVRNFLDEDEWKYEYDDSMKIIRTGVNLKCKLQSTRLIIRFTDDGMIVLATISMNASEEYRPAIAEYLTRANYGLKNGNFEMDFSDGEIRYKVYTNYKGLEEISREIIEDSIMIPPIMIDRYGDGLAALMFGFSTPEEEIRKVEGDR